MASSDGFVVLGEETSPEDERAQRVANRWARLLRYYWGIRRLQLLFSSAGTALRVNYTASARDRVADIYRR